MKSAVPAFPINAIAVLALFAGLSYAGPKQNQHTAPPPRPAPQNRGMQGRRPNANPPKPIAPGVSQQLNRLSNMSPEERQQFLDRLPPERRQRLQQQLQRYNQLSPQEKQRIQEQLDAFHELPRSQQQAVRRSFQEFRALPDDRRPHVRQEIQRLRNMSPEQREARLTSEDFRTRYTPQEQDIIEHLSSVMAEQ